MKRMAGFLLVFSLSLFTFGCGGAGEETDGADAADADTGADSSTDSLDIQIPTDGGTSTPETGDGAASDAGAADGNADGDADGAAKPPAKDDGGEADGGAGGDGVELNPSR